MTGTRSFDASDDRNLLALAAGLVAALLGAGIWAGMVMVTDYEVGWVAWAIGGLVGLAMGRVTQLRSRQLAVAAAVFALVGLLAGKAFVVAGSAGAIADELRANTEYLQGPMAWQMFENEELDAVAMDGVRATHAAGDTLSDALWADMLAQSAIRLESMSEEARSAFAGEVASGYVQQLGLVDGVMAQLSGFDLLWLFLALGTAFRMMDAPAREPEAAPAMAETRENEPVA